MGVSRGEDPLFCMSDGTHRLGRGLHSHPRKNNSTVPPIGGGCGGAEVAPARCSTPGVNLRRDLRVGSWNIRSLTEVDRLPHLSTELRGRMYESLVPVVSRHFGRKSSAVVIMAVYTHVRNSFDAML